MVAPAARRRGVEHLIQEWSLSERRACRLTGLHRSVARYRPRPRDEAALIARLKALATAHPRYGYLMLHAMLQAEGLVQNRKRTYRLYTALGLQVRTKRRKRLTRPRVPLAPATRPNERWSVDFVSDQLASGRRFRVFCIVDDHSRECVGQIVVVSISGARGITSPLQSGQWLPHPAPAPVARTNAPQRITRRRYPSTLQAYTAKRLRRSVVIGRRKRSGCPIGRGGWQQVPHAPYETVPITWWTEPRSSKKG